MSIYLDILQKRTVTSANYITFLTPSPHPDRILEEHDFLYMLDGNWTICEEEYSYTIESGDLLILPAGRHHYHGSLCSPGTRHMYIHVNTTSAERDANTAGAKNAGALAANSSPDAADEGIFSRESQYDSTLEVLPSVSHCQNAPQIKEIFEEIISLSFNDTAKRTEKLSLLFSLLLCQLLEHQEKAPSSSQKESLPREIAHLLQSTPQKFFSAREVAARYYICERTLTNHFKKEYGKTFHAYQMDLKLEMVRQFLTGQPRITLRETALNFGFYDEFHLSKTFKKKYGIAPSQYRTKHSISNI